MQYDIPGQTLRGNPGTEDANSEPKNTVDDRKLEAQAAKVMRETRL